MAAHFPEARLLAFGSRVTGGSHGGSDLDMAIDAGTKLDGQGLSAFLDELEESNFTTLYDVFDFHRLTPKMQQNILEKFVVLWPDEPEIQDHAVDENAGVA
jgi:predicted nucleotidyltransferase